MEGLVANLGREHDFHVICRDRDEDSSEPYPAIVPGRWQRRGDASVYYASPWDLMPQRLASAVRAVDPHGYYVNSFLTPAFSFVPVTLRSLGVIPRRPMIVAPRGELHPRALRIRQAKKAAFIELARRLPGHADVIWQAGTPDEAGQIHRFFPGARVAVARDLTALAGGAELARAPKRRGELRIVYLSRITPMKNLIGALRMAGQLRGSVHFDIYGPAVEQDYVAQCLSVARTLPDNVRVTFVGDVAHDQALETLSSHHVFLLPTFGESFGHAILEALVAGLVLVISDQTPWRALESTGAGWDLALRDEQAFVAALQSCVDMNDEQFALASSRARQLGAEAASNRVALAENRALFDRLSEPRPGAPGP
jgi:glycosyltransferase involved in cell wall biosynthesis